MLDEERYELLEPLYNLERIYYVYRDAGGGVFSCYASGPDHRIALQAARERRDLWMKKKEATP
jgi:hypothetical protein